MRKRDKSDRSELQSIIIRARKAFFAANAAFPTLRAVVVKGPKPKFVDYILGHVVTGTVVGPSSLTPPYHVFAGGKLAEAVPLLRALVQPVVSAVVQLIKFPDPKDTEQPEPSGTLPRPWHFVLGKGDSEYDWLDWMIFLFEKYRPADVTVHSGPVYHLKPEETGFLKGDHLLLPNGKPIGRSHDGDFNYTEDKGFRPFLRAVKAGERYDVIILESPVFYASAVAADLLVRWAHDRVVTPSAKAKRGRQLASDPAEDKRIYDAWKTKQHRTYEELGLAMRKTGHQIELAVDRHEKRLRRGTKSVKG